MPYCHCFMGIKCHCLYLFCGSHALIHYFVFEEYKVLFIVYRGWVVICIYCQLKQSFLQRMSGSSFLLVEGSTQMADKEREQLNLAIGKPLGKNEM